jgi:signal transduction histidine kinase/DNA-binding NarL/FixJ family response regulator
MQRLVALDRHLSGETEYYECELRVRGVDDAWIWVMDRGKVLEWDARHQPTRMSGTLLDISARKLAEGERILRQRAEAESRAKSDFLARMSHEIRTPMNAILGYAQLLRRESGLTTRQRDYLEIIDRSGGHLLSLINQVLDLARADAGHLSLVESEFDLHVLLNDVQRMFYLAASQQGLRLTMQVSSDLPSWVLGDAGKIRQVLINLIGNALKFTEVGSITVRGWTSPVETGRIGLVFEVEDTGSGIDSTDVKTIFEAFGQTSGGARKSGAGLGLTVSRRIARQMGGDLTVTSVPGGGSVFRFEAAVLPTDDESRQRAEHRIVGLAPGQRTRRILVVDGHAESRILLERLLESVGFDVREAATGDDALSAIQAEPPDLLLLGVDGDSLDIETARRFRASCPAGLPLVVISDDVDGAAIGSESGNAFDGVLGKPLQEAELFAEIARLLGVAYAWPDSVGSTWSDSGSEDSGAAHVVLPGDLRDALCLAVESGYPDVIAARISAIVEHDPVLGRQLRGLADDFDYATLLHLINEPGGS